MKHIPDFLWCELEKLIPERKSPVGRPEFDNKKTFEGILFILRAGIQWCELPEKYGCYTTVHGKYMKWARTGVFHKMMVKAQEIKITRTRHKLQELCTLRKFAIEEQNGKKLF